MAYSVDFDVATSEQIEAAICARLEKIRLDRNITQSALAEKAQIGERTLRRMENGEGVTLNTLIRVLMALDLHQNLKVLLPDPSIRPIERITLGEKDRQRASGNGAPEASLDWNWGNDDEG